MHTVMCAEPFFWFSHTIFFYLFVSLLLSISYALLFARRYIVPLLIGFVSILLRTIADWTCTSWSQTCKVGSEVLSHIYQVVFFFLVIVASTKAKQVSEAAGRMKKALEVVRGADSNKKKHD